MWRAAARSSTAAKISVWVAREPSRPPVWCAPLSGGRSSLAGARAWSERATRLRADHPVALAVALYGVVAAIAAVAAYFAIFTSFAGYDDQGTLSLSLESFAHGDPLYRDVYSPYGPFYYELFGGFFALTGWAVGSDAGRLIVIAVWITASCLIGVSVQRLSGRLMLGVTAMIVTFAVLTRLTSEPMHPHGLAVLLLGVLTLLLASGPPRRNSLTGAVAGALLGALILTKINLGGLAVAAIALAAVLTIEPLYRRRWLRWLVIAAFLAMPLAIMQGALKEEWVRELIALEFLATTALLLAARSLCPQPVDPEQEGLSWWLVGAILGFAWALVAIVACLLLTGTSLADLYDGAIVQGAKLSGLYTVPFISPYAAIDWAVAAVAAAALAFRFRRANSAAPPFLPGLARAVAGLAIWFTVAGSSPASLNPASNPDALPLVLTWIAVLPPAGLAEGAYRRFLRAALAALALSEAMQVYPVAGSQMWIGAVPFIAVGGICIADGLGQLRAWSAERGQLSLQRFGLITAVVIVAVAGKLALGTIVRPGINNAITYADQTSLDLSGASRLHLPDESVAEYERLVSLLHSHHCTTFSGYPNLDSLYHWSGIEPPKPSAPGAWVIVLDDEGQQRIVDQMRASARPCAIRNDALAGLWLQESPMPDTPLVNYIVNDFRRVATAGGWEFLVAKGG